MSTPKLAPAADVTIFDVNGAWFANDVNVGLNKQVVFYNSAASSCFVSFTEHGTLGKGLPLGPGQSYAAPILHRLHLTHFFVGDPQAAHIDPKLHKKQHPQQPSNEHTIEMD